MMLTIAKYLVFIILNIYLKLTIITTVKLKIKYTDKQLCT